MLFLSHILLGTSMSKRIGSSLCSAAQTGYRYFTKKSPQKAAHRLALRKHDPKVNKHVIFYETRLPKTNHKKFVLHNRKHAEFMGGKHVQHLLHKVEKQWQWGSHYRFFRKPNALQ
eukprot:GHVS01024305.1.p1 GENE.GHVS01024305.1~~GHVS01024305.1.p1  ORF type:complete len:116 (+),score=10.51 GHVS01024305.1:596-943(+)